MSAADTRPIFAAAGEIAAAFVRARLSATALDQYPGPIPPDRAGAYDCQEAAIPLWPDEIAGWKIGRPAPGQEKGFGDTRLAGPIFQKAVRPAAGIVSAPFIANGFAAVEAEYVIRIGRDAPEGKADWTTDDAAALIDALYIGVELAGSPFPGINALGPCVTVSDFGNNAGLILGPEIADWRARAFDDLRCETFIDGASVGRGAATNIPGGPLGALAFLLGHCAARGRPLKAGQLVSTGAATGVHEIRIGQAARISFGRDGEIECAAVRADAASQRASPTAEAAR